MKAEFINKVDNTSHKVIDINNKEPTIINTFDLSILVETDPLIKEGYNLLSSTKCKTLIRYKSNKLNDLMKIRIFYKGEESKPDVIKLEMSSETDIYFYFICDITPSSFRIFQEKFNVRCFFNDFLLTLKNLIEISASSEDYKIFININEEEKETIELEFIKVMSHKDISTMRITLYRPDYTFLKKVITHRINFVKTEIAIIEDRIDTVSEFIKEKNPTLYSQVKKTSCVLTEEYIMEKKLNN